MHKTGLILEGHVHFIWLRNLSSQKREIMREKTERKIVFERDHYTLNFGRKDYAAILFLDSL